MTIDVLADGSRRPGGGAFYSALQAARLGQRTLVITRGVPAEIEAMMRPFAHELTLRVLPARSTTTLETVSGGQRLLAWAGPVGVPDALDTNVLHLAPVAHETASRWRGRADFVGLTAQGLVRAWAHEGAMLERRELEPRDVPERCDAVVVSEQERASAAAVERELETLVAVTRGDRPTIVAAPGARPFELHVPPHDAVRDDVGAGDVFAAALFTALARGEGARAAVTLAHAAAAVRIAGDGAAAIGDAAAIDAQLGARW
ncbi:MAG TPA: PfkB family carbohydrate kinase [Solirubrobacteraceae bacterium]|nr:PfkB family carbohydrate kinase [Solirubrobacteraceae bacterium]